MNNTYEPHINPENSPADVELQLWLEYLDHCDEIDVAPTIRDFVIWKEENGKEDADVDTPTL